MAKRPAGDLIRTEVRYYRLTQDELKRLEMAAASKGLPLATWIRELALWEAGNVLAGTDDNRSEAPEPRDLTPEQLASY